MQGPPRNNLELFRAAIKQQLPSEEIDSPEEFRELVAHLCDIKLLSPSEVQRITHKINAGQEIAYPFAFKQLEQLIMTSFADPHLQQLLQELGSLKGSLRETKGVLAIWKDRGLSEKERLELESTFERGNTKVREFYGALRAEKEALEQVNEQQLQMMSSLEEWVVMQKLQLSFRSHEDYQSQHQRLIDSLFSRLRVREVHFRDRRNTSKLTRIEIALGLDSRTDQPVQVTILPRRSLEFEVVNEQLVTFNALRELTLSPAFSRFLGHNNHSDPHCFLYFTEHLEGRNLADVVTGSRIGLEEDTPLFEYWACCLYRCLYDIFLMCSYVPRLPIALADFDACSGGLRLVLKRVRFAESREESLVEWYEAELLQNLGGLLLGLLRVERGWEARVKKIQNRSMLSCLLNAKQCHRNYSEGRAKASVTFFNLQTHPLFETASLTQGQTIVDNYEAISSA